MGFNQETLNIIMYVIFGLWALKKVAEMESFHEFRVMLLTLILSFIVVCLFCKFCFTFGEPYYGCDAEIVDGNKQYTCYEY